MNANALIISVVLVLIAVSSVIYNDYKDSKKEQNKKDSF